MIANVSAHRRANAFAQALEELSDRGTAAEQPEGSAPAPAARQTEQGRMLALTTGLDELPKPVLDPEVKVVHRAQLVAAMEAMLRDGTLPGREDPSVPEQRSGKARGAHRASPLGKLRPRSRLTKGLAAGGLSVGVAASAFGGVAAASSDALPGDSLYGLKRGIEDVKLTLADDSDDRGRLYLDQASTRLSEARRLMERGRGGQLDHESLGEIRRALTGMRHDASEGHRLLHEAFERDPESLGPIRALSAFSRSHREAWGTLRDRLPVQLGDVSQQVSSVFDAIDDEVAPHSSLLPQPPTQDGDGRQRSTDSGTPGTTDPGRPAPSVTGGSVDGGEDTTGKPKPSTSDSGGEGLVGGTTGGLLDPPQEDTTSSSPSTGRSTPAEQPDVTLPPLLPGLIPGLGIDGDDSN
ncbi:DUF5667 domain-containing protein [Streptomyces europaeiscabiei]|uniref:DUF5667 domain-containing protein n=1 Tax=Streptomyces TaxID=1883 RepID=UPI000A37DBE0|nr:MULTISPECIES: DUF5667 domain-containing protein [Streptomyces]MDX3588623.1 DUF5667 domain-containing protein [Streptomyces europaeiscabiei]MDX3614672.1 DUF5667 domain-containing protein [Streptomyces europaeiscabiei]MDX3633472.1 DUF5667 domain-containing protein [Streptomyces europaeiscabiei]MDX3651229.1 DUF5667 domain-containing protein [Streptomyces europaeiscabiei]WUD34685.1 DUF5667 domain-containing protein [Streptomyces europaeiscabiei]